MNDLLIKANTATDNTPQAAQGRDDVSALAGFAGSFQDILHKAGARIEDGFSALASHVGFNAAGDALEAPRPADDFGRDQSRDGQDRFDDSARADNSGDKQDTTHRADQNDDYGRDHGSEHREDGGDTRDSDHGTDHADDNSNEQTTGEDDTAANEGEGDNQDTASDDGEDGETNAASSESNEEGQTESNEGETQTADSGSAATQAAVGGETVTSTLLNMGAGGEALSADGVASELGKVSSTDGIAIATQAVAANASASENTTKTTPVEIAANGAKGVLQAQASANNHALSNANGQSAVAATEEVAAPITTVETQAAGIAKAVGDGTRAQVTVSVTNESQALTSKPSAALTTNTVLSGEGSSKSTSGQQAGTHTPNGGTQGQTAQAAIGQAQVSQNQAAQTAQANTDAKGLVQAMASTTGTSGGIAHAGGGEGVTQVGGVTATGQTQQAQSQSAAEQAKNAEKPVATGRSMVEQISVKISKAIQAGSDKITIQLRPVNMGRVEVKLEMGGDSRLSAMVIADNRETLDMLQKDSRELQRALQDAGLQADSGDLNFSLRGEENQGKDEGGSSNRPLTGDEDLATLEEIIVEEAIIASDGRVLSNGRIDVRA